MVSVLRVLAVAAIMISTGVAQQSATEKRVKDISASQSPEAIESSPFCQEVRASKQPFFRAFNVNPATMEPDLAHLMQKSDEVVLAGYWIHTVSALSPSEREGVTYYDVRVLRAWKGSHHVGDVLTFGHPGGPVNCGRNPDLPGVTEFRPHEMGPMKDGHGLVVLFLQKDGSGLVDGFRLTGGEGTQGIFSIPIPNPRGLSELKSSLGDCLHAAVDSTECTLGYLPPGEMRLSNKSEFPECKDPGIEAAYAGRCAAAMQSADYRVVVADEHLKKYDGMRVATFLKEIQAVADSGGESRGWQIKSSSGRTSQCQRPEMSGPSARRSAGPSFFDRAVQVPNFQEFPIQLETSPVTLGPRLGRESRKAAGPVSVPAAPPSAQSGPAASFCEFRCPLLSPVGKRSIDPPL